MHTFTDSKGKEWALDLNLAAAERIDRADFSLLTKCDTSFLQPNEDMFQLLASDTSMIFACIWCIVHPEATAEDIDQDGFKERISPSVIPVAKEAFWGELKDFFPEMGIVLLKAISAQERVKDRFLDHLNKMDKELNAELDKRTDDNFKKMKEEIHQKT